MDRKLQIIDLADGLARRSNMPHREAETFVRLFFEAVEDGLLRENIVKVKSFGTFKLVDVETRESVNVQSGERIEIARHTKVSFTPDAVLRDAVNKPFAQFETVILNEGVDLSFMENTDSGQDAPEDVPTSEISAPEIEEADIPAPEEQQPELPADEPVSPSVEEEETPEEDSQPPVIEEEQPASSVPQTEPSEPAVPEPEAAMPAYEAPIVSLSATTEPTEEIQSQEQEPPADEPCCCQGHGSRHTRLAALLAVACLVIGYCIGYHRPISLPSMPKRQQTSVPAASSSVQKSENQSSAEGEPASMTKPKGSEKPTYPQVEGGEYTIVGVKAIDVMSHGKTLINLSLKYYKSEDFVPYICAMNGIENPDIVPLDMELKIPELQHR